MPVGNMIVRSEKGEIWGKPQTSLGPGQYSHIDPDFKPKSGLAPFSSTAERHTTALPTNTPGPGTYDFETSCIKVSTRPSPQFLSQSERMGGERQRMRAIDTPGPGAYTGELVQVQPKAIKSKTFHTGEGINWVKVATAPSIPSPGQANGYEEGVGGKLIQQSSTGSSNMPTPGPGAYNASLDAIKSHGRIYQSFGRANSAPKSGEATPGPGAYDVRFVQDVPSMRGGAGSQRMQSMFASTTGRAKLSGDTYGPGPGGYKLPSGFQSLKQFLAANPDTYSAFGSSAKNPRAVTYDNNVPGPGSYVRDGSPSKEKLGSQFASSSKRFGEVNSFTPGPGNYDDFRANFTSTIDSKTKGRFGVFGTTSSRFQQDRVDQVPAVGSYESAKELPNPAEARRRDHRSSAFRAPSRPKVEAVDERSLQYNTNKPWPKAQTTSQAFISTVPRFGVQQTNSVPGPGSYTSELNVPRGNISKTPAFGQGSRFGGSEYQNIPGPGSYNVSGNINKKTFNITIGEKW